MTAVLVDANVLLDILIPNSEWVGWSARALAETADSALLVINPIVFAEVSVGFDRVETLEAALPPVLRREPLPWDAAFLSGKVFLDYRRRGGSRTAPLPDFFIGAHAAVRSYRLLTRDTRRYRTYFPTVQLIAP